MEPVRSKETPRCRLAKQTGAAGNELPIRGGWGYSRDDACIIDSSDAMVDPHLPFNGNGVEQLFVEMRIHEALVICRGSGEKFQGIECSLLRRERLLEEGVAYDQLTFEISAFQEDDWEELKAEYEGARGADTPGFDHQAHETRRQERTVRWKEEFWFDVTSFADQELQSGSGGVSESDAPPAGQKERHAPPAGSVRSAPDVPPQPKIKGSWWQFWRR